MEATIDESALRGDGSLKVAFTDEIDLLIPVSAITEVSSSVNEPVTTIHLTSADLRATVVTENKASTIQGLAPGWYVAMETKAPSGYILDSTPQVFQLQNAATEQALTFYNTKKASSGGSKRSKSSTPETPVVTVVQEPAIGKLTLWLNGGNGFSWPYLLPQTEDNGEAGSSILFAVEQKRSFPYGIMASVLFGIAFVCGGVVLVLYRKKREDKQK
jgi:hypothetical protein